MIYFTSDTHFGHKKIMVYCQRTQFFGPKDTLECISDEAVECMDNAMIERINAVVGRDDTLYHLGDFAWRDNAKSVRDKITCQNVHLIWGNHDKRSVADLFSTTHDILDLHEQGQHIVLCHYPMRSFNKSHRGAWNLYGHVHGALDGENADDRMNKGLIRPKPKTQDVGVDSHNFHPWSFDQLKALLG